MHGLDPITRVDFAIAGIPVASGLATLVPGATGSTVTVSSALVTSTSPIQLTGQDDDVTGALRATNRVVGTSFDIVSSNGADSGVVSWVMYS